jgi:predicted aspartyl protease
MSIREAVPIWHRTTCHHPGRRRRVLAAALRLVGVLVVLGTTMMGCTAYLKGMSGPVAWQATDLRIIERSVSGADRDIYAFALVLEETQGSAITFTNLEYTVSQPGINPTGVSYHSSILWKLRSRGELRQPFSFYWNCDERQCPNWVATAPWYNIILTGTNAQGQPIRVAIDLKLPQSPPKLQRGPSQETLAASPLNPASVPGSDSGPVPFQTVGNHVLVSVLLNQKEHAILLVDTGASHTFLTPDTAKRLGVSPAADAPKHTTTVIGGRQVEFPLVTLSHIAVGQAMRENLQVGVLASFPNAPLVDGILGGSFLKDFTMTLDYATSRLRLVLKEPLPKPPPTPALALATMRSAVPIQLVGNHVLVRAVLNHTEHVTLLLDTGATYTLLTPTTAQRLGLSPPADTPRRTLRGADGQPHEVPFVQLSALAVGEAMRENLPVGISVLFPRAPSVDGLLGGDFLEQFKMTLDRGTRQMWLESPQTERP